MRRNRSLPTTMWGGPNVVIGPQLFDDLQEARAPWLMGPIQRCGILNSEDIKELRRLLCGAPFRKLFRHALGIRVGEENWTRVLHFFGWPEDPREEDCERTNLYFCWIFTRYTGYPASEVETMIRERSEEIRRTEQSSREGRKHQIIGTLLFPSDSVRFSTLTFI